jgi:hypothetical protein
MLKRFNLLGPTYVTQQLEVGCQCAGRQGIDKGQECQQCLHVEVGRCSHQSLKCTGLQSIQCRHQQGQ